MLSLFLLSSLLEDQPAVSVSWLPVALAFLGICGFAPLDIHHQNSTGNLTHFFNRYITLHWLSLLSLVPRFLYREIYTSHLLSHLINSHHSQTHCKMASTLFASPNISLKCNFGTFIDFLFSKIKGWLSISVISNSLFFKLESENEFLFFMISLKFGI